MTQLNPPSSRGQDGKPASATVLDRAPRSLVRWSSFSRIDELVIMVVLATMPLTYVVAQFGGFQLSGWAWVLSLMVALVAVVAGPIERRALRNLAPYLVFLLIGLVSLLYTPDFFEGLLTLGQVAAPAVAYLVAFRTPLSSRLRRRSLQLLAFAYAAAIAAVLVVGFAPEESVAIAYTGPVESASVAMRPISINLVAMFVLVSALSHSRIAVLMAGAAGLAFTIGTGSRIATGVLLLMIWASPRVFGTWRARGIALLIAAALAPAALSLPVVQDRLFFGENGTVGDVLSLSGNVDTAGRRELWPKLVGICQDKALTGCGIGASYELSRSLSEDVIEHPHNDYIRTFCDTGILGSVFAWWFVVAAGVRNLGRVRARRRDLVSTAAMLATLALLLLAMGENVLAYPAQFGLPVFMLLAWADQSNGSTAFLDGRRPLSDLRGRGQSGARCESS